MRFKGDVLFVIKSRDFEDGFDVGKSHVLGADQAVVAVDFDILTNLLFPAGNPQGNPSGKAYRSLFVTPSHPSQESVQLLFRARPSSGNVALGIDMSVVHDRSPAGAAPSPGSRERELYLSRR